VSARVGVACKLRLAHQRSKFLARQFLVNLFNLRREGICGLWRKWAASLAVWET